MSDDDLELLARLSSPDPLVRREAARALGERRVTAAVPALADALRRDAATEADEGAPAHTSRAAAAVALGRIGDPSATAALLEAIADPFNVGTAASTALGRLRPPPTRALVASLNDADRWRRARAVMALGEIGDRNAFEAMAKLLQDPEEIVQRAAASAFEKLRDPRAIDPLMRLLGRSDATPFVRSYAAMTLGALRARDAVSLLLDAAGAPEPLLRRAAARALCRIDEPSTRDRLVHLAEADPDPTVRAVVQRYLTPREGQRRH